MGKIRSKSKNKIMIPSAEEARQMYNAFRNDEDTRYKVIHDKLAELITNEAKLGKPFLVLNRDNFFEYDWPDSVYEMFKNEFVPTLENIFKYHVEKRDTYYYIIYFFKNE